MSADIPLGRGSVPEMGAFDLLGPLPRGTTLLEASAGTGKTFTLGALVTRYVAEGVARLDEMLVITFTRAASQELRERVRAQLLEAQRTLASPETASLESPLTAYLLQAGEMERAQRLQRLTDALAAFDAATIATTHQFCQTVLRSLGVAGDTEAGARLVESLDELVVEIVDDLYLARFGSAPAPPPFGRQVALAIARTVVEDSLADLADADPGDPVGQARVSFARDVRAELERRKRRLGVLSYDDLLARLAHALEAEDAPARARMRARWSVVLVDEFQDTDPVQWQVLRRAFDGHATLVLIGDPKQAIYGFRGGDVVTYLDAARTARTAATLGTNWRTDAGLVAALRVVLDQAALGDPDIAVRPVDAHHGGSRLEGAPHPAPLRLRQVRRDGFPLNKSGLIGVGDVRPFVAADCAADIATLLGSGARWCGRPVRAGDVAVLVPWRSHGALVRAALEERGIPAVMAGGGDVFQTPAAEEWLALLEALAAPHRAGLVHAAALTCFLGRTVAELDVGGEEETARLADVLRGWGLLVRGRGVAALLEAAEERGLTARVLAVEGGERLLTDVRHLGQLLHEESVRQDRGLTALLTWFRDERRRQALVERPRRLESDAAAVQIFTLHGSKGLEWPITYVPFAWDNSQRDPETAALFHAPTADGHAVRTLDVSVGGERWRDHVARHHAEELGEELRKLYVALTRAQSQAVLWWAPTFNTRTASLHRLLFGRRPGVAEVPDRCEVRDDDHAAFVLGELQRLGGPVHEVAAVAPDVAPPPPPPAPPVAVRSFDRAVDLGWRRTSYSGLIRVEEELASAAPASTSAVGSEPEVVGKDDEEPTLADAGSVGVDGAAEPGGEPGVAGPLAAPSPMAQLPAGATFGSLVHAVLEHADPEAPDLRAELLGRVGEQLRWWPVPAAPSDLAEGLLPLQHTPLGPLADGLTLAQIPLRDRLRELEFEFPLAGGDRRGPGAPEVMLRDLAPLLRTHLPEDDPLRPYADRLDAPAARGPAARSLGDQPLRGYLSGSVDAVLRLPSGRFVIVDYKTNHLGETAADYTPDRLAEAMLHSHYPLQAMLYTVVAHRFLRWRVPGYDPEGHLGGVLYLYVRGMLGPSTPLVHGHATGVFSWRPPAQLVLALSDLLDGGGDR